MNPLNKKPQTISASGDKDPDSRNQRPRSGRVLSNGHPRFYFQWLPLLFISVLSAYSLPGYSQENTVDEWNLFQETEGVKCYYLVTTCNTENVVQLKIVNETVADKAIVWRVALKDVHDSHSPSMPAYSLKAGQAITSDCGDEAPLKAARLQGDFVLSNLIFHVIIMP